MELIMAVHILIGEMGILAFLWTIMEFIQGPSVAGMLRARVAALSGTALFFAAWLVAGTYYLIHYGSVIKPVIKAGPWPWAHSVFMEVKEHIFLFLPVLAVVSLVFLWQNGEKVQSDKRYKAAAYILYGTVIFIGLLMTIMGYFISSGYREALTP